MARNKIYQATHFSDKHGLQTWRESMICREKGGKRGEDCQALSSGHLFGGQMGCIFDAPILDAKRPIDKKNLHERRRQWKKKGMECDHW